QIPFSDPIADGQTIMRANALAQKNKITVEDCFKLLEKLKQRVKIPLLFMTYYNIPFTYGLERFCHKAKESGCYGLIIPDIPFDEEKQEHYLSICKRYKLHAIQIISLLTPENRLKKIAKIASGFIYCVSRTGTTGESKNVQKNLDKNLKIIKKIIKVPLALGFGISTKQQIEYLRQKAEILVIGSKILNIYNHAAKFEKMNEVNSFLSTLLS
ncbi:tryptophan synthase subunit alpha, partial [Candidatus Peregrinibacteria bacterium RIFOXYC2_FULL_33_13]